MRRPSLTPRPTRALALLGATLLLHGCAVNPATGRNELMLVSEAQEIEMGRSYDPQIVASIGLYPDSALQRYVQQLGSGLAAASERPGLPWTFRVLDDPTVNAFAVPGGFIYVTRGIMAHLNSEAQLVSVLGHEIGHVTARHSARSMSRQQAAQIGLVLGSIASDRVAEYADLASQGLGVLFLKHSRDDENQADALGVRYMQLSKHDVREMPGVFTMLEQLDMASGGAGGRLPGWLATHPSPEDRRERIGRAIAALPQDFSGTIIGREAYERRLDGLVYGVNPRQGYFEGGRFRHPDLRFQLNFPNGWATKNEAQAVLAMSAEKDAAIELTLAREASADAASRAFLAQEGLQAGTAQRTTVNGLNAMMVPFGTTSAEAPLRGTVLFVEHGGNVYQIVGYAPAPAWAARQGITEQALRSFAPLTDQTALNMQPQRLDIVTLDRRSTISQLLARRASPVPADRLGLLNQLAPDTPVESGQMVKWVVGPRLP